MALLWIDGFDSYGTSVGSAPSPAGIVGRKYATVHEDQIDIENGRLGGYGAQLQYDFNLQIAAPAITTDSTLVVGFAFHFKTNLPANPSFLIAFYDGTQQGMNLRINSAGEIEVRRNTTSLETTSGLGLLAGAWYYLELKVVCGSSGTYEVRLNTVTVANNGGSAINTKAGTHNYHDLFMWKGTSGTWSDTDSIVIDDAYCLDGSGSVNNDFLGNMRVVTLRPDEAGDSAQFTPDTGDNYARVNEEVCGDDSNYVEDATTGHEDLYGYAALTGIVANIKGIMVCTDCRETDATPFTIKTVCKPTTTDRPDAGQSVGSTTYVTKRRILETNPDGTDPWDVTSINATQFGVQVG